MLSVEKALNSPLLSPPTSPRMSAFSVESANGNWHDRYKQSHLPSEYTPFSSTLDDASRYHSLSSSDRPPLLRSHKSVPQLLESHYSTLRSQSTLKTVSENTKSLEKGESGLAKSVSYPNGHSEAPLAINTSIDGPSTHLTTPTSPATKYDSGGEDDTAIAEIEDDEEDLTEADEGKTAAERRADKRKMKRFRLTHNQTRFLMNEFARQAHPDAQHRERLSREIPGLSPRQVQVWFQNRRAKMKRLTVDDQERMLKSRALPEDFDMTQALHSPYGGTNIMGTPMASPVTYAPPYGDAPFARPLMIDSIRKHSDDETTTSPLSLNSGYSNHFFTPPTSDNVSPISTHSDRHFGTLSSNQATSPRGPQTFARSSSFSSNYHHPQIPRLQIHDRVNRARAESLQSPLRSSMSYSSAAVDYGDDRRPAAEQPSSSRGEPVGSSYGLGHQSKQMQGNPEYALTKSTDSHVQGFQSNALHRMRPMTTSIPPGLQLKSEYRTASSTNAPRTPGFPMQSAPLAPPPEYHFPQLSAPYHSSSFGNVSYAQHTSNAPAVNLSSTVSSYGGQTGDGMRNHERSHENPPNAPSHPINIAQSSSFEHPRRSFTSPYEYSSQ